MYFIEFGHQLSYNSLKDVKKDVKIKKNILNISQLETIRDYGCRILVIFSSMCDKQG